MDRQDLKEGQEVYVKGRVIHTGDHLDIILDKGSFIENAIILHHEKPVIPQFVAKWLEDCKGKKQSLYSALQDCDSVNNWLDIEGNEELFARAWLDGYEVEKERCYRVTLSNGQPLTKAFYRPNIYFSQNVLDVNYKATRKELEDAGLGWVFDCEGVEVQEVE
ncbi:DUF1642 domain-containing protein [Streptococcus constellatus]|uniref:DUF1642 domain-containing protein n=1 Tax=Streptococcus constellatus TaxID=76860 RepID=UPI002001632F|nr:DUF1642 domain-containing protein [Streptococcus constellatus]